MSGTITVVAVPTVATSVATVTSSGTTATSVTTATTATTGVASSGSTSTTGGAKTSCSGVPTDLTSDPHHCGKCVTDCTTFHEVSTATCVNSTCEVQTCKPTFADCDLLGSNGCELFVGTDVNNCGGCGVVCVPGHAKTPTCKQGVCGFVSCQFNYGDCDGNTANGCETFLGNGLPPCGTCTSMTF